MKALYCSTHKKSDNTVKLKKKQVNETKGSPEEAHESF
jgi:hypothetical protein